jgi:hypothetical protein
MNEGMLESCFSAVNKISVKWKSRKEGKKETRI